MLELTIFNNVTDNKTHRKMEIERWDSFVKMLKGLSEMYGEKQQKGDRFDPQRHAKLFTPAIYNEGATRSNNNVDYWSCWCALDIDDYDNFDDAIEPFAEYRHVMYSSASSTEEKPKFRIILNLSRKVMSDEITHLWYAVNEEFGGLGDAQTKDKSRMYYVPAQYPDSFWFFHEQDGKVVDVDAIKEKHPYFDKTQLRNATAEGSLNDKFKNMMNRMKMSKMNQHIDEYTWSSYSDCPFVNQRMIDEYTTISGTGWYHQLYRLMVSIAAMALRVQYPITVPEVETLVREIDAANGNWYKDRPIHIEAKRAIDFVMGNN